MTFTAKIGDPLNTQEAEEARIRFVSGVQDAIQFEHLGQHINTLWDHTQNLSGEARLSQTERGQLHDVISAIAGSKGTTYDFPAKNNDLLLKLEGVVKNSPNASASSVYLKTIINPIKEYKRIITIPAGIRKLDDFYTKHAKALNAIDPNEFGNKCGYSAQESLKAVRPFLNYSFNYLGTDVSHTQLIENFKATIKHPGNKKQIAELLAFGDTLNNQHVKYFYPSLSGAAAEYKLLEPSLKKYIYNVVPELNPDRQK